MERTLLIFCAVLAISQGRVVTPLNSRIVNGTEAKSGEIPFQVSLQVRNSHFCGGSILNENYVVTAAHCVVGKANNGITVVVGTINYKKPGQIRQSARITVHENYKPQQSHQNDVALIKVSAPFTFSNTVQPVPLPELNAKIETNSTAVVSGWGRLGGTISGLPEKLQKAQIWVADQKYCADVMQSVGAEIHPTQICANDPTSRRGQCNGDSGGPLIVNGKLTGIVSWSIKDPVCASTKYPGVYTRVPEFVDWIVKNAV